MIREAVPAEDIDELFELWKELMLQHQSHHDVFKVKPNSEPLLKQEFLTRIREKGTKVFVCEVDNEPVGMLVASIRKSAPGFKLATKGCIGETIVKKELRSSGAGSALVDAAKKWFADNGADHMELQVSVRNPAAARFWEAQGFVVTTQHMVKPLK